MGQDIETTECAGMGSAALKKKKKRKKKKLTAPESLSAIGQAADRIFSEGEYDIRERLADSLVDLVVRAIQRENNKVLKLGPADEMDRVVVSRWRNGPEIAFELNTYIEDNPEEIEEAFAKPIALIRAKLLRRTAAKKEKIMKRQKEMAQKAIANAKQTLAKLGGK